MNPYLSGGYAPIRTETETEHLTVEGEWPMDIGGTLYRIGPNPQFEPIEPYNPMMGDGMVHAFRISEGTVSYRNRWVRTRQWRLENEAGRALFSTSGDPRLNDPSVAAMPTDGVANTNLVWHGKKLLALEEGHPPIELDPISLVTKGVWDYEGRLPHNMTAHPKIDSQSGEMIFFANEPQRSFQGELSWYIANSNGVIVREGTVHAAFPSLVHDFAVTRDFIVFIVCPVTISVARAVAGGPPLAWEPDRGTHIGVVRRDGRGDVQWFQKEATHVWHILNAWNQGAHLTIELCEQQAPAFPLVDGSMSPPESLCQKLGRWELNLDSGNLAAKLLSDVVCEYPRIDDRFATRAVRHGYFTCHGGPGTGDIFHRGIGRYDHEKGQMTTYFVGKSCAVSEPIFVPSFAGAVEGDGYLLCVIYDESSDRSELTVFNAECIEAGPSARAQLDQRVPMGFHGCWIPGTVISQ